ncbi:hypothetical protein [Salinicoccus roseus]|uniref:Uncharacterized protein n=1 Tax=Salinicoccus roseus TaxID=45670 RepID=A0A265E552_9STAP|nr:hypothetical protein [Salinicoccus roseus]OZT76721.1 hypothetical protein CFN03_09665 [Salinicoccus roseus]
MKTGRKLKGISISFYTIGIIFYVLGASSYIFCGLISCEGADDDTPISSFASFITEFAAPLMGVMFVAIYNILVLEQVGNHDKILKNTEKREWFYKYYGLDKKRYSHHDDLNEEIKFERLCDIIDNYIKTAITNGLLFMSGTFYVYDYIVEYRSGKLNGFDIVIIILILLFLIFMGIYSLRMKIKPVVMKIKPVVMKIKSCSAFVYLIIRYLYNDKISNY